MWKGKPKNGRKYLHKAFIHKEFFVNNYENNYVKYYFESNYKKTDNQKEH